MILDYEYDKNLVVDKDYITTLPDIQNGSEGIKGARVKIQRVGISNFKLPLNLKKRDGSTLQTPVSVSGTVSLEAEKKGINMSRIMRTFYEHENEVFNLEVLESVLKKYKKELDSFEAKIDLNFSYPIKQKSLRSKLEGYQYYNVTLEGKLNKEGVFSKTIHFDFVYSSACPCSYELGLHAMKNRNKAVVSHSQRSVARVSLKVGSFLWIEEIQEMCLEALRTEVQVMVKREDEQAFAELNGSYLKFVEDSCRLLFEVFDKQEKIEDFKVICSHMESLHGHDACGIIVKGIQGGFTDDVDSDIFKILKIS